MHTIFVNGLPRELHAQLTVALLLQEAGYADRRVAVELNGAIVPKSQHAQQSLQAGDRVEVVQAIGGG